MEEIAVEITKISYPNDPGVLKAFVDIEIPKWDNWMVRGIRIFETDRNTWVQMPSETFENDEGKMCYNPWTGYKEREKKDRIGNTIIKEYRAKKSDMENQNKENIPIPENLPF